MSQGYTKTEWDYLNGFGVSTLESMPFVVGSFPAQTDVCRVVKETQLAAAFLPKMRIIGDNRILKHINLKNLSDQCDALIQENVKTRQYGVLKRVSAKPRIVNLK